MGRAKTPDSLVLWRDPAKLGRQEGYLCFFAICPGPHCDDPHLFVNGYVVDDRYVGTVKRGKKSDILILRSAEAEPVKTFAYELHTQTGAVRCMEDAPDGAAHLAGFNEVLAREGVLELMRWMYRAQWNERELHYRKIGHEQHHHDHGHAVQRHDTSSDPDRGAGPTAEPRPRAAEVARTAPGGAQAPRIPHPAKVGPNDRCPCGSGKKYKICCG